MKITLRQFIITVVISTIVIISIYIIIYTYFDVSNKDFGPVGDSVGGILTPVFTLITIVFLYINYNEQHKQNKERENELLKKEKEFQTEIQTHHEFNVHESYMHSLDTVIDCFMEYSTDINRDRELHGIKAFELEANRICGNKYQPNNVNGELMISEKVILCILDQLISLHKNILNKNFTTPEYRINLINNLYLFYHSSIEPLELLYTNGYNRISGFPNYIEGGIAHNQSLIEPVLNAFETLRNELNKK